MSEIKVSQDFEVMPIQKQPSYIISKIEWGIIKKKIGLINNSANTWENIGFVLIGTALTTFITGVIGDFKTEKSYWLCWTAFAVTIVAGILCLLMGRVQKGVQKVFKEEVLDFMNNTEERFKITIVEKKGIVVISASYAGIESGNSFDAKEIVEGYLARGVNDIPVNNETFGDPHPYKQKKLSIECKVNGEIKTLEAIEGAVLRVE